jgi:hypothetical protein
MAIKLEDKPRVDAPDSDYPYGKIRDKTPTEGGTPINTEVYGDFHQFFAKMLAESGVVANGLPDNEYSGFQYFEAFINLLNSQVGKQLVLSMIGTYTTNDLVILHGCEVTANIPGTSEITAGAIYYNGEIYIVDANNSISSPSNTLVFIVKSETPNIIELVNGAPGSGLANYDGATVKNINGATNTGFSVVSSTNLTGAAVRGVASKINGVIYYSLRVSGTTVADSGYSWTIGVPANFQTPRQDGGGFGLNPVIGTRRNITDSQNRTFAQNSDDAFAVTVNSSNQIVINFGGDLSIGASKSLEFVFQMTCRAK